MKKHHTHHGQSHKIVSQRSVDRDNNDTKYTRARLIVNNDVLFLIEQ